MVSHPRKMGKSFSRKKGVVHSGLQNFFTKNLDWRVKFVYTYHWVTEHISSVTRERYVFFSPE